MGLQLANIGKSFDGVEALRDVTLEIGEHEFVCLLGPSGCGKTTLLRIVAGLLQADRGSLSMDGEDLARLPPRSRNFGIVFQSYSLFPNMTVRENIGYGLRIRRTERARIEQRVDELLALIQTPGVAERYPWQLSGGQQQRVALARALAVEPRLILLDEPLSALDARVRNEMRRELRDLQRRLRIPTIMVTHDQEEALMLADVVVCMNRGMIEQAGSPQTLYQEPRTRFIADFIGVSNLFELDWLQAWAPALLQQAPPADPVQASILCVRPEHVRLTKASDGAAVVRSVTFLGNLSRIGFEWGRRMLVAEQQSGAALADGDRVHVHIDPAPVRWVSA
ncbi:MAG: ABC transporter ATP-binding protein [Proteobacteria bacterium]|jgi:iron(III) transport system ATP-binding protein|nr:ABC transporter ATP-binding protein [Pseudomonadota bacterium]HOL36291.1 ABC transporter ATP-binding protein [Rubrivivax sp.]